MLNNDFGMFRIPGDLDCSADCAATWKASGLNDAVRN